MSGNNSHYMELKDIPSLPKGWVRLVHRCIGTSIGKDVIANIKENGLIFNRRVTEISPSQRGGAYDSPGYMVSVYNEELFWQKLEKDDFYIFDDAKYADTQIIFDMPMDEYCFLEKYGRVVVGKIDKKYISGVIPNYNGHNKKITLPKEDVQKAKKISENNPPANIEPIGIDNLINKLQKRFETITKERILHSIEVEKENIIYEINEELKDRKLKTFVNIPSKDR
ncbi:MAG: hypothetical protein IKW58_00695 [Alphaproteobacteria bacterium]|nr:hypothetical protein [Alphaproteobacteria bacterium]